MPYDYQPRRRPLMTAENQYAEGQDALPNLDPAKMGLRRRGTSNEYEANGGDPSSILQYMSKYNAQQQAPAMQYEEPQPEDDAPFMRALSGAQARAGGQRSSPQIAVDNLDADQLRYQQQAQASRMLAAKGFAPSSAIGLEYQKDTDRQVAELMERRRAQNEESGRRDVMALLAQQESRRAARAGERQRGQALDQESRQFLQQLADQQRAREEASGESRRRFDIEQKEKKKDRPLKWLEAIAKLFSS